VLAFITYQPEVAACGRYRFEVYIPADFGLAQSIHYEVTHRDVPLPDEDTLPFTNAFY
jgi:hypothetical protein